MGNKDRFSNFGAKLGKKLDDLSSKIDESGIKEEAKKLYNKATEVGGEAVKKVAEKFDDAPIEEKYCVSCGKRINNKKIIKILDGELCSSCASKYTEYINTKNIQAPNISLADLNKGFMKFDEEQKAKKKKTTILVVVGLVVFIVLDLCLILFLGNKEHEGKLQIPEISSVYYGKSVDEAKNGLSEYGFTNIWVEELKDLEENQIDKENIVEKIEIEGSSSLDTDDWVEPTAKVTIYIHSKTDKVEEPIVEESINTEDAESSDSTTDNSSKGTSSTSEDADEFAELMNYTLAATATEVDGLTINCTRLGGVFYVDVVYEGAYDLAKYAKEISGEYHKSWNELVDSMTIICNNVKDSSYEILGTTKYTTALRLHNDYNYDDILLKIDDGRVKEDVVNNPSLWDKIFGD